jgi:rhodanese-related sulfurtransferase
VDVRSPEELSAGSIPGSQLIPFGELARGRMSLPAGQPLLLICAVGGRSYAVGQYFSGKGYREIYNLSGGIRAWKAAGLELQRR